METDLKDSIIMIEALTISLGAALNNFLERKRLPGLFNLFAVSVA